MATPIGEVNSIPVWATPAEFLDTGQETGNLAASVTPPALYLWDGTDWVELAAAALTTLEARLAALEARIAAAAQALTEQE